MNKASNMPLVVDLDGTLTPTDTLVESIIKVVKQSPLNLLRLPMWLLRGRAGFKNRIAAQTNIDPEHLPYRGPLLDYLHAEKARGRHIVLATAAHKSIAERVSTHLGLFDKVLATDSDHNLKGKAKLKAIQEEVGEAFVYAGDSHADLPIWKAVNAAILVGVSAHTAKEVRRVVSIEPK